MPPETTPTISETPEETAKWEAELKRGARTYALEPWGLLNERVSTSARPSLRRTAELTAGTPQAQPLPHARVRRLRAPHLAPDLAPGADWGHDGDPADQDGADGAEDAAVSGVVLMRRREGTERSV